MVYPRYLRNSAMIVFAGCLLALPAIAFAQAAGGSPAAGAAAGTADASGTTGTATDVNPNNAPGTQLPNTNGAGAPGAVGPYPTNPSGAYVNPNCAIAGSSCYGSGSATTTPAIPTTSKMEVISGTPTTPGTQTAPLTQPRRLVVRPARLRNKRVSLSKPRRIH